MGKPETIMIEEHYSITIARALNNRMEFARNGRIDDASNTYPWAELWTHIEAWAKQNGHPTVAGNFPVFFHCSFDDTHDGATCPVGDVEIARVSESYARAIDDMRRAPSIALKRDGSILFLADPEKRERVRQQVMPSG